MGNIHVFTSLCSSFSASAHKFAGPKGVGWLICKEPIKLQLGGEQEMSMRGGTENYPAIISMFTAWQDIQALLCSTKERAEWRRSAAGNVRGDSESVGSGPGRKSPVQSANNSHEPK